MGIMVSLTIIEVIPLKRFIFILTVFLFLSGCSNAVNGIDKQFYNQSESYAKSLLEVTKGKTVPLDFFDNINKFLNQTPSTEDEKRIISLLIELDNLSALYTSQVTLNQKDDADKSKVRINSIVDTLENEYGMNIR